MAHGFSSTKDAIRASSEMEEDAEAKQSSPYPNPQRDLKIDPLEDLII